VLDRYEIGALIGKGGAGAVFRGRDRLLEQDVAIKVLLADGIHTTAGLVDATLQSEARAAMRLAHPAITRVYHYERRDGWEFLIMEFVPGRNLAVALRSMDGPFSVAATVRVGLDVLEALEVAHRSGIIHNDINPKNILQDDHGMIKVCDFGLASHVARDVGPSRTVAGTLAYMAPERISGEHGTVRSDLYALASTLFHLVTGAAPFGTRPREAMRGHAREPMPRSPLVPPSLDRVLRRAMEKDPAARYPSAQEMHEALVHVLRAEGSPRLAHRDVVPRRPIKPAAPPATVPPAALEAPRPTDTPPRRPPTPAGMAWVSGGSVSDAGRVHPVRPFFLDTLPVTNAAYARFVAETGEPPPDWWVGRTPPPDQATHPVTGVCVDEARRYAAWAGGRLPTATEWLRALRGDDERPLPWGKTCDPSQCACPVGGAKGTVPTGAFAGNITPEGVRELLGNVWEWTEPTPEMSPDEAGYHHVFGGSWRQACGAANGAPPRTVVSAHAAYRYLGFRCARSVAA
jgi:serine/threonine protein kinase